jgi:hypothetical protein
VTTRSVATPMLELSDGRRSREPNVRHRPVTTFGAVAADVLALHVPGFRRSDVVALIQNDA